jgi:hypothetical protein
MQAEYYSLSDKIPLMVFMANREVEGQSRDSLAAEDQPSIGKISIAPRLPFLYAGLMRLTVRAVQSYMKPPDRHLNWNS